MANDYEIPAFGSKAQTILGWCLTAESEGRGWLTAQRPTQEWDTALQALSAPDAGDTVEGQSNLGYNKVKRIARELVAGLTDFRHDGEFKVTQNEQLFDQAHALSDLDRNWYNTCDPYAAHRAAVQYAVATGTAYLWQTWDKNFHSPYRGDIRLQALAPGDVTFIQLPKDNNYQRAYAVIIREEMPLNLAKAVYGEENPGFAASLTPDRDAASWLSRGLQKVQQFLSPALRVAGRMQQQTSGAYPVVDIFHMYTLDNSHNEGAVPVDMGRKGTNWSYTVPALGDEIPLDSINPQTRQPFTISADRAHTRMFPLRRYTIFSRTALCYDGPSPYWHGKAPIARLRFCDWAWEALGSSLVSEGKSMQDGIVAMMRGIEDAAAARLDPPMLYNDNLVSRSWAQAFNARKAGSRAAAPLDQGTPIEYPVPVEHYNVPQWITDWITQQEGRMDYLSGVADLVAIAKAKQVPGADTMEKLMEMAGPIVRDNVRALEGPLQELGEMRKSLYLQFYTAPRMLLLAGQDGVAFDKKYVPEQLLPTAMAQDDKGEWQPAENASQKLQRTSSFTPEQRTTKLKSSLDDFRYHVTESGINEINRMSQKLFYLQLMKTGFPISWWTFAKIAAIPNFGPPPEGTNTEMERWVAQQRLTAELQQSIQADAAAAAGVVPGAPDGAGGEGAPAGTPAGGSHNAGRPPSFEKPAHIEQKDGGERSTVSTS